MLPSNKVVKEGYPLKIRYFVVIFSYSVETVADIMLIITSTGDDLFRNVNIDDLKPLKIKLVNFS